MKKEIFDKKGLVVKNEIRGTSIERDAFY